MTPGFLNDFTGGAVFRHFAGSPMVHTVGGFEDWIRVPADERELWTRLRRLAELHDQRRRRPRHSDGIVLDYDSRKAIVSAGEGSVLRPLLDRFGELVRWDELIRTLWPDGGGTTRLAAARVSRLRTRIAPTGLVIHSIQGRGVLLDHGVPPH